jgi:hypothetical protein
MPDIETMNKWMVAGIGGRRGFTMLAPPKSGVSFNADDALLVAAYLVSMAEPEASHKFEDVLKAVQNT